MNWQQYEDYMFDHVVYYTITEFHGCAKYSTWRYDDLQDCTMAIRKLKAEEPQRRVLMYAICQPPNRLLTVSLPIAEHRLP
jgi:hypothetical protein